MRAHSPAGRGPGGTHRRTAKEAAEHFDTIWPQEKEQLLHHTRGERSDRAAPRPPRYLAPGM